jgi:hypothetical protein
VILEFSWFILQSKELGISGNLAGDGYQNGGTLIVSKGKLLDLFVQNN